MKTIINTTTSNRLRKKIIPHGGPGSWCIYGTPSEIMILVKKYKVQHSLPALHVQWIQDYIKRGESNPQWFYFQCSAKKLGLGEK